jgi:glycosyltransferase involved in cell wall biosynthesis
MNSIECKLGEKPLRIVLVLLEAPVPFGHAASRWSYVLLRELMSRGHDVTCFAACSNESEMSEARRLFPSHQYDLRLYPFPTYSGWQSKLRTFLQPYSYMYSPELQRDLEKELKRGYDILHLEQLWTGWLGIERVERAVVNVLCLTSVDSQFYSGNNWRSVLRRILLDVRAERRLLRGFPNIMTLSDRLRHEIERISPTSRISVVPLGLDASLYEFIPDQQRTTEPVISVIGSMNWYPTYSAAVRLLTRLWPEIKRRLPDARVQLVGWNARSALREFENLPDIEIAENVPDTQSYFQRTGVLLYAPERGTGMKVKVLEAFAFGVPVVTTSEGVEGIPAIDGVHAGITEDDAGLIVRTVRLLQDQVLQNRQRASARALLESHCGPQVTVDAVENVYRLMVNNCRSTKREVTLRVKSEIN